MSEITLGTIIKFDKVSSVEYVYKNLEQDVPNKEIVKKKLKAPFEGMVIGKLRRATGQYSKGNYESQPSLIVDKFHDFYEVRTGLKNKPVLVHPDDIEVLEKSKIEVPDKNDLVFDENSKIYSEGNNGGDFFELEEVEPGMIKIKSGSCCVYNHDGIYPTEYVTKLLEYAFQELKPEIIFQGWRRDYVEELIGKIKHG